MAAEAMNSQMATDAVNTLTTQKMMDDGTTVTSINLNQLSIPDYHPRSSTVNITTLSNSIKKEGILTPLTVMQDKDTNQYIVLDGTRRLEAAKELKFQSVPAIIRSSNKDADAAHTSYVINMERKSLNPVEIAKHIKRMKKDYGYTNKDLTIKGYGTSGSISKTLKILDLPEPIQKQIVAGKLTPSHGRELLKLEDQAQQKLMAKEAVNSEYSATTLSKRISRFIEKGKKKLPEKFVSQELVDHDVDGVYLKDSRDMQELSDESVQLVVTTPPNGLDAEGGYSFETMFEETKAVFAECNRVLVPGGVMAISFEDIQDVTKKKGTVEYKEWMFTGSLLQNALRKHNIILTDVIHCIGSKKMSGGVLGTDKHTSYRFNNQTSQVLIFRKKGERKMPADEIKNKSHLSNEELESYYSNVWNVDIDSQELSTRIIKMFSFESDTVLDPWLGSGTTVKAARDLTRNAIGYERNLECMIVIKETLGLIQEEVKGELPITMTGYAKQSLAEFTPLSNDMEETTPSDLHEPKATFITNIPAAELESVNNSPALPA